MRQGLEPLGPDRGQHDPLHPEIGAAGGAGLSGAAIDEHPVAARREPLADLFYARLEAAVGRRNTAGAQHDQAHWARINGARGCYGLLSRVRQALTSAVVRLEDTKRFTIFADHFAANSPNPSMDSVGRSDEELTSRKLLNKDFAIGAVSEALNPMRKSHHVAVA